MKIRFTRDTIIFGAAAILIVGWWGMSMLRRGSMNIALETPTVKPGGVITIRQDYRHEWGNSGMSLKPEYLQVLDQNGKNIYIGTSQQFVDTFQVQFPEYNEPSNSPKRLAFSSKFHDSITTTPGVMDEATYAQLIDGRGSFLEIIGCPVGLGVPAGTKPPPSTTERQSFRVFPGTPPGEYRIVVPAKYYCGAGPFGEFTFRVE